MDVATGRSLMSDLTDFLRAMAPETLCHGFLQELRGSAAEPARVFCLGKAAPGLALAASRIWPGLPGLVYGTTPPGDIPERYEALFGSHPIPTEANVQRTREVRRWLSEGSGPLLAVVSGGGSSLLVAPREPWTLDEKAALTASLLNAGASVRELNVVRARLSQVKAGGLLRHVRPWPVTTLIWSDVGPRDGRLVAGGPTVPWRRTVPAEAVLCKYALELRKPLPPLAPKPRMAEGDLAQVLCDAAAVRRAYARHLRTMGFAVKEILVPEGLGVEALSETFVRAFMGWPGRRPRALVGAGEATVKAKASGRGGRCSHLAAAVAKRMLKARSSRRWLFAAVATDGVDGGAGAGAWTDWEVVPCERELGEALESCDTGTLWEKAGTLAPRNPSGNNLRDVWVLVGE